jgi:hypothetical protein
MLTEMSSMLTLQTDTVRLVGYTRPTKRDKRAAGKKKTQTGEPSLLSDG